MATKWKYTCVHGDIRVTRFGGSYSDPSEIWNRKDKEGKTIWDSIVKLGEDGWELVNVTSVNDNYREASFTACLVYTFKKSYEDNSVP